MFFFFFLISRISTIEGAHALCHGSRPSLRQQTSGKMSHGIFTRGRTILNPVWCPKMENSSVFFSAINEMGIHTRNDSKITQYTPPRQKIHLPLTMDEVVEFVPLLGFQRYRPYFDDTPTPKVNQKTTVGLDTASKLQHQQMIISEMRVLTSDPSTTRCTSRPSFQH